MKEPPIELIEYWIDDAIQMIEEGLIAAEAMSFHIAFSAAEWGYNQAKNETT